MHREMLCTALTAQGVPCKNIGKPHKTNLCNTHSKKKVILSHSKKATSRNRERKLFTAVERYEIIKTYGDTCYLCLKKIDLTKLWHIDHIRPFSKGGSDKLENLRPTHKRCNELKNDKILEIAKLNKTLEKEHSHLMIVHIDPIKSELMAAGRVSSKKMKSKKRLSESNLFPGIGKWEYLSDKQRKSLEDQAVYELKRIVADIRYETKQGNRRHEIQAEEARFFTRDARDSSS